MVVFFLLFFTVYSAINYYLFIRGWQALQGIPALRIIYLIVFLIAALSYIAARSFAKYLPLTVYDLLTWIGSFWFAYILYVLLFILLFDLIRVGNHFFDYYPAFIKNNYVAVKHILFFSVFLLSTAIITAGYINTRIIKVKNLSIEAPGRMSDLKNLRIVMASDLHLSTINNRKFTQDICRIINSLNPDIVLIPGDIVDDKSEYLPTDGKALGSIKAKYGVFASTGNHEFINGVSGSAQYIAKNGINLLRDEAVLVNKQFYIIGREGSSKSSFTGTQRKTLKELTSALDPAYPVLLMDHTPFRLGEAAANGIDFQVSGHTHHGQMFPLNFITNLIYEVSWGYKKINNTHFYVSSGVGTWGPPVRTGSSTEIVFVEMKFL